MALSIAAPITLLPALIAALICASLRIRSLLIQLYFGVLVTFIGFKVLWSNSPAFGLLLISLPSGICAGFVYWVTTGRTAARSPAQSPGSPE
jgi:hypothetical protein